MAAKKAGKDDGLWKREGDSPEELAEAYRKTWGIFERYVLDCYRYHLWCHLLYLILLCDMSLCNFPSFDGGECLVIAGS